MTFTVTLDITVEHPAELVVVLDHLVTWTNGNATLIALTEKRE